MLLPYMLSCIYSEKQIFTLLLSETVHGRLLRYGQGFREKGMKRDRKTENCTTTMIAQLNAECIQIIVQNSCNQMHRVSVCVMRSYIHAKSFLICRAVVAFKYLVAKLLLFGKMITLFYNNNFTASLFDYLFSLSLSLILYPSVAYVILHQPPYLMKQ